MLCTAHAQGDLSLPLAISSLPNRVLVPLASDLFSSIYPPQFNVSPTIGLTVYDLLNIIAHRFTVTRTPALLYPRTLLARNPGSPPLAVGVTCKHAKIGWRGLEEEQVLQYDTGA